MIQRDPSIDVLRFIGLSLLILAHVDCPDTLRQIRLFDVPLMVFISGLSYSGRTIDSIGHFYKTRLKRLLIPVWTFIPIYLLPHAILQYFGLLDSGFSWNTFFCSFIFYGGMGYIWIYKVFIIVMFATPLLIKIDRIIKNDYLYFLVIIIVLVLQQVLCYLFVHNGEFPGKNIIETYGLYILGYLPMFMLGLRVKKGSQKAEIIMIILMSLVLVISVFIYYSNKNTDSLDLTIYKYPPQFYYIVYGCFMSLILWSFRKQLVRLFNNRAVMYIGKNTDWIYLWHAFFVLYITHFIKQWFLQYVIIYSIAIVLCCLQKSLTQRSRCDFIRKYF